MGRKLGIPLFLCVSLLIATPAHAYYREAHDFRLRHATVKDVILLLVSAHIAATTTPPPRPLMGAQAGDPLEECAEGVPVKIQRRSGGAWKTLKKKKTSSTAKLRAKVADRKGKYRLLIPAYTSESGFNCFKGKSTVKRHSH